VSNVKDNVNVMDVYSQHVLITGEEKRTIDLVRHLKK
jgi:hypothetical protein